MVCCPPVFRMRSVFLLVLLVPLVFSDESNEVISSHDQPEMLSNWPAPCQRISDLNAYGVFIHKYIIQHHFDVTQSRAWADYLTRARLCGAQPHHSFLHKNNINAIVQICRGESLRDALNLCVSMRRFRVFVVTSVMRNRHCDVQLQIEHTHVVVTSGSIHLIHCVYVHLDGISHTVPHGQPCR